MIAEAKRLAGLAEVDWKYQVGHGSAERLGIAPRELEQYVKAAINDRKKAAQELERGADKQRQAAEHNGMTFAITRVFLARLVASFLMQSL